jgi:hypothetical protein
MAILKCKSCGGSIQATEGTTFGTCESCGSKCTLPKVSDDRRANLLNRANHLRRQNEFDKAIQAYENILIEDSTDAEAHWGILLSKYGVEYVEDPVTHNRIPTCHRVQRNSILSDPDYQNTIQNAPDEYTKSLYEEEANRIYEIQREILAISNQENPYDVFICYKERDDSGNRTKDSVISQDIYNNLDKEGYRVFFARITLEKQLGNQYEPYIFNALNSAKVMLVVGTKKEYFDSLWVKNEWSRYLNLMKNDHSKLLIPCYRDMDAYDLPEEMSMLQAQDIGKIGFIQDIIHGIKKVTGSTKTKNSTVSPGVESLTKRGYNCLADADWKKANECFDKVLDLDHEYAPAYIGLLCVELRLTNENDLAKQSRPLEMMNNFAKALQYADSDYSECLNEYLNENIKNVEQFKLQQKEDEGKYTKDNYFKSLEDKYNAKREQRKQKELLMQRQQEEEKQKEEQRKADEKILEQKRYEEDKLRVEREAIEYELTRTRNKRLAFIWTIIIIVIIIGLIILFNSGQ